MIVTVDNTELPQVPCPVCSNCDHDLRAGVLELNENVVANVKDSFSTLLDAMEAEGDGGAQFAQAIMDMAAVRHQLALVIEAIPDIALIKAAHAE